MSRTAATWALARPKTLRVGSPATTSRKWPARRWRSRAWRAIRTLVEAPTSDMNTGISGTVTAMITAEIQSAPDHHDDHGDRDDHRQEQLGEVAGEIAVERVDPAGGQDDQAARAFPVDAGRPEAGDLLDQRRAQVRTWPRPRPGRPSARRSSRPPPGRGSPRGAARPASGPGQRRRGGRRRPRWCGDQPRLGQHQQGGGPTEEDGGHQVAAGALREAEQSGIDRSRTASAPTAAGSTARGRRSDLGGQRHGPAHWARVVVGGEMTITWGRPDVASVSSCGRGALRSSSQVGEKPFPGPARRISSCAPRSVVLRSGGLHLLPGDS